MKSMTASPSTYWLWKFYLGIYFFFMIQNILWAVLLFSFCTNFWSNALICFCNVVLSRRIRNSVFSESLCYFVTQQCFPIQYDIWSKIFKWKIVSEYLIFRNLYKHKNNTVKNLFLHAFWRLLPFKNQKDFLRDMLVYIYFLSSIWNDRLYKVPKY